jgi:cytochrome b involved in lipid metabolism
MGNKVREALSATRQQAQMPNSFPAIIPKDKRRLHKTSGQVSLKPGDATGNQDDNDDDLPHYTLKDISVHDTSYDCWVIIYDKVYDITNFLQEVQN